MKGFLDFIELYNNGNMLGVDNVYIISHDDLSLFDLSKVILVQPKNDEEIAYYMNKSDIFISTSWWEGFGLPSLEAMACGCAVILSDAGGVNEYATANENSLMYKAKRQDDLLEHINCLAQDTVLRNELSSAAVKKALSFSWNNSKNQFLKVINASD